MVRPPRHGTGIAIALLAGGLALAPVPSARAWTTLVNGTLPGIAAGDVVAVDAFGNVPVGGQVTSLDGRTSVVLKLAGTTEVWRRVGSGDSVGESVVALAVLPGGDVIVGSVVAVAGQGATGSSPGWLRTPAESSGGSRSTGMPRTTTCSVPSPSTTPGTWWRAGRSASSRASPSSRS